MPTVPRAQGLSKISAREHPVFRRQVTSSLPRLGWQVGGPPMASNHALVWGTMISSGQAPSLFISLGSARQVSLRTGSL